MDVSIRKEQETAGVIHVGPIEKQTPDLFREAMESDFFAMLRTTYAALPPMLERRRGAIVNIASIGGKIPVPHLAPYVASKFATVGFSETLHAEVRSKGVHVLTVNPGLLRTGSAPNAVVVGQQEKEYRWFKLAAVTPGVAHSPAGVARKIVNAVHEKRSEIEIGLDAYLAARIHGLAPGVTQYVGHLANELLLPSAKGSGAATTASQLPEPTPAFWSFLSRLLSARYNQPAH